MSIASIAQFFGSCIFCFLFLNVLHFSRRPKSSGYLASYPFLINNV